MQPKISIIVPIYNVEKYINKCIDSILAQTFTDFELILVDDGSPDNCGKICDDYAKKDSRIKVIHKKNGGLSSARNAGLDIARGEYIGFVDSDDWIKDDMYELLHKYIIKYDADISICGRFVVNKNKIISVADSEEIKIYNQRDALLELVNDKYINNFAWDKLYKKKLFENIRYPEGKYYEDIATTYKLFALSEKIVHTNSPKYYYLKRDDSICGSSNCKKRYDYFIAWNECLESIESLYPQLSSLCKCKSFIISIWSLNDMLLADNKKNFIHEINDIASEARRLYPYAKKNIGFKLKSMYFLCLNPHLYFYLYPWLKKVKRKLKLIIPIRLKNQMRFYKEYFSGYRQIKYLNDLNKNQNYIFLVGTPDHGNLGDQAIAYAENEILKQNFKEYSIKEITTTDLTSHLKALKKNVKENDIFILQGGGNIGDEYLWEEYARRRIINYFSSNKIIIFPQTIYFKNDKNGKKEFELTKKIYNKHKHLTIVAREKVSYGIMKESFINNKVLLSPDIVMYINKTYPLYERKYALLCIRSDREGILSKENKNKIKEIIQKYFNNIVITDTIAECKINEETVFEYMVSKYQREKALNNKWNEFKRAKLIITDRLHGMIFAAITSTPCIVISNYNHKVKGTFEWLKHLNYIRFVENLDEIDKNIEELSNIDIIPYDNSFAEEYYKNIIEIIK